MHCWTGLPTNVLQMVMRHLRLEDLPAARLLCKRFHNLPMRQYMPAVFASNYTTGALYGLLVVKFCCAARWPVHVLPHLVAGGAPVNQQLNVPISVTVCTVCHVVGSPHVSGLDNYRVTSTPFLIHEFTQLGRLIDQYCGPRGLDPNSRDFLFDGVAIDRGQCAYDLGMAANDRIDVVPKDLFSQLLPPAALDPELLNPKMIVSATRPSSIHRASDPSSERVFFKISKMQRLGKLMDKWGHGYALSGWDSAVMFVFRGRRIDPRQCAYDHAISEGDHIVVMPSGSFIDEAHQVAPAHAMSGAVYILWKWAAVGMPLLCRGRSAQPHISATLCRLRSSLAALPQRFGTCTPLLIAAGYGHTATVAQLLCAGAAEDAVDKEGSTALQLAVRHGHVETVQTLL